MVSGWRHVRSHDATTIPFSKLSLCHMDWEMWAVQFRTAWTELSLSWPSMGLFWFLMDGERFWCSPWRASKPLGQALHIKIHIWPNLRLYSWDFQSCTLTLRTRLGMSFICGIGAETGIREGMYVQVHLFPNSEKSRFPVPSPRATLCELLCVQKRPLPYQSSLWTHS